MRHILATTLVLAIVVAAAVTGAILTHANDGLNQESASVSATNPATSAMAAPPRLSLPGAGLEQVKAECTRQALSSYAWWSVALYSLDVEERYVAVFAWLRLHQGLAGADSAGRWGASQESELERLITAEQKQRAERRIQALLDRCWGA